MLNLVYRNGHDHPFSEVQNLLNSFFQGAVDSDRSVGVFAPRLELADTDQSYHVTAELPGVEEKDVDLHLEADALILKGEKKAQTEEKKKGIYRSERVYGAFQRTITLPEDVDREKIEASFKNGVLTITLPKAAQPEKAARKIEIRRA
jgi:HSP20 family protein